MPAFALPGSARTGSLIMKKGTVRTIAVAAVALVGTFAVMVPAQANGRPGKTDHQFTTTSRAAQIEVGEGFPAIGSTSLYAGLVESRFDGGKVQAGAGELRPTITGQPGPTTFEHKDKGRVYYSQGSLDLTYTCTATLNADASITDTCRGEYKGHSGAFRAATGTSTVTCSSPTPSATVITCDDEKGVLSY
jgi:hypothetical protein